jgi:hypothetical protein
MASRPRDPHPQPLVYLLVPGGNIVELLAEEEPPPLGPLAEPEPLLPSASPQHRPYGPWAHPRRRTTKGLFLDRYAC